MLRGLNLKIPVILVLVVLFHNCVAQAEPVQLSLCNPIQLYPEQSSVEGVRLNLLYGRNQDVTGFDIGLVNCASRNVAGLQVAAVLNIVQSDMTGAQLASLCNYVNADVRGVQCGSANIVTGSMCGGQIAVALTASANITDRLDGIQLSAALISLNKAVKVRGVQFNLGLLGNHADDVDGVQISATCNSAANVKGLQFGIVNYCEAMSGIQIGLLNIIRTSPLPFLPIVNASF